jgi:predicted PurR-regulated permease PerM
MDDFWNQFWPQFWGGVASALFVALLTLFFTYVARLRITRWFLDAFERLRGHRFNVELSEEQMDRLAKKLRERDGKDVR